MDTIVEARAGSGAWAWVRSHRRRWSWLVIVVADVGLLAWAAMAALATEQLTGPRPWPTTRSSTPSGRSR